MLRTVLASTAFVLIITAGFAWSSPQAAPAPVSTAASSPAAQQQASPSQHQALVSRYCATCHNQRLRTAGLTLDQLNVASPAAQAETWEKVVRKLRAGQMPPAGVPRPDRAAYDGLIAHLEAELDREAAAHPNPGGAAVRRLNRAEYTNAIRDLLGLEIDGDRLLPADDSRYGFDNIGDVLTLSPLLLERYMAAARKISRLAIGDPAILPAFETYEVPKYYMQEDRMEEGLPFGSRGGIAVRHHFPLDGDYIIRVRLHRNSREYIRGMGEAHQFDLRVDGEGVKLFAIGGERHGRSAGIFSTAGLGDAEQENYERTADAALEARITVKAGVHVIGAAFVKETVAPEGPLQPKLSQYDYAQYKGGDPAVASVAIGGPFDATGPGDTLPRQRIFICKPAGAAAAASDDTCAGRILSNLARRAYRRPVTAQDSDVLMSFYRAGLAADGFEAGIRSALERILVGPEFLFRVESDPANVAPGSVYRLSDVDLASRLSFFLWSSIPDDELLAAAERGQLRDPAILEQQVRRMLADPRAKSLVENFAGQWLYLRNLRSAKPDPDAFPYFDDNLREGFQRETELFFESMLREDRSVTELLTADYTFVNERLARHYGIPNVYGNHFRRVSLPDPNRSGLLGQGSILTVTSHANRTSPVVRGKWVLDNLLGAPPPPPPADVPDLKDRSEGGKVLTMRERMQEHRANPVCASCHKLMDPIGFALENFDAIGRWRAADAGAAIDASGETPDGTKFEGPAGLRQVLLNQREQFVATVTERLLTYALGRGVEYYDAPAIRQIVREAARNDYRWSALFLGVVKSTPFQMRRASDKEASHDDLQ
jgi:mono/diheme cytochrome c family protein